ncbi:MAG TPA: AAA family ATPase [Candidatus Saccharimonadales bacterium]|nr:AAA family ATPase [Candidatus Saccharimonadales bacterium]
MKKLIILRGYPGSGKTTIGKALEAYGAGTFIDHNALLTYIAGIVGDDNGIYDAIYTLECQLAKKLLSDGAVAIVARGFSRVSRMQPLLDIAETCGASHYVITLDADMTLLEKRILAPERQHDFNPTTTVQSLHDWIAHNQLEPYDGGITIDASRSIKEICTTILEHTAA